MKLKDNAVIYLTSKLWKFSAGNRRNFIFYIILFIFANAIELIEPIIIAAILSKIQTEGVTNDNLFFFVKFLLLYLGVTVGFWFFHGPARVIEQNNAFWARANYKKHLLDGTLNLSAEWHTDHHSGDTIDKIEKASSSLFGFAEDSFEVYGIIMRFIGAYIALAYFHFSSIYFVLIITIIAFWLVARFDKKLIPQYRELYKTENTISEKVYDIISNITTVIILRVEKLVAKDIYQKIISPFKLFNRNIKLNEIKWFMVSVCGSVMTFLVIGNYLYGSLRSGQAVALSLVYILYSYVGNVTSVFFRFTYLYGNLLYKKAALNNVEEITREFQKRQKVKELTLASNWHELKIKKLSFSYELETSDTIHLDNINLSIMKGEKIALVGESGSGKTTLMKIIRELYTPQKLELYLDGQKLKDGFRSISSLIALIPQDPEIFATTIKENITIGVNYPFKQIKKFTDMACFTDVAMALPKQFNSSVVEKGVNLSGGQKQRLALARGLLASVDKEIILLDEPTSSVDFENELKIYENIFKRFKKQVIISSIHRLHLLSLFDKVIIFKKGRIIATGSLRELLRKSPEFIALWDKYQETKNN